MAECFEFRLRRGESGKTRADGHNKFRRGISERIAKLVQAPSFPYEKLAWHVISFIAGHVRVVPVRFSQRFPDEIDIMILHSSLCICPAYSVRVVRAFFLRLWRGRARDKFCKVTPAIFIPSSCALSTLHWLSFVRFKTLFN